MLIHKVKSLAPALLTINLDSDLAFPAPGSSVKDLVIGHHIKVRAFATKIINGVPLEYHTYYTIDIPATLRKNGGMSTTLLAYGRLDLTHRPSILWLPAVLAVPAEARINHRRPVFVSRFHLDGYPSRSYQYVAPSKDLLPGELVWTKQVHISPGSQVGTNFVLPRYFRQQPETERVTNEEGTSYLAMLYLDHYGPVELTCNPLLMVLRTTLRIVNSICTRMRFWLSMPSNVERRLE